MATPGTFSNPASDIRDLKDEKLELAYEEGHDADVPSNLGTYTSSQEKDGSSNIDLEKGTRSHASSSSGEAPHAGGAGGETVTKESEQQDPNVVWWDGDHDPKNPMNWPAKKKWGNIFILAMITLITPLASSFFAPAVPQVLATFHESSTLLASFVVSVYLLGFAFGPLLIAPMSELYGRYYVYTVSNTLFVVFNIACAVSSNFNMLIGFRFLAGCAGSSPLTIGAGTIADMMPREKRAGAMAIWAIGPLIGPVVGPVAGGFLAEAKGWRWIFWVLAIFGGFFSILAVIFLDETYAPVLLQRKAKKLRKETGNMNLRSKLASDTPPKELFRLSIVRPMKMLILSPIVLSMSIYISINYGILYLLFTTFTFVFEEQYGFSSGIVGLTYIGSGIGMMGGMVALGILSDKFIKKHQKKGNVKPEHRLPLVLTMPGGIALPIGLFIYGWTADKHVFWFVPIFGTVFVGLGMLTCMMTIQTYLVDAFTLHAASAMAANTVLRSIFGALLPLSGLSLYDAIGLGWGNSLLGFIALAMIPVPIFFRFYGERIRTHPKFQVKLS